MDEKEDYEDLLKIKAIIWEIKEGKPTKLKALGIIFVPEEKSEPQIIKLQGNIKRIDQEQEEITHIKEEKTEVELNQTEISYTEENKDKGRRIANIGATYIFENVLAEVKDGISKDEGVDQLISRIAPYYPNNKPTSHGVYLSAHRRFLEIDQSKLEVSTKDKGEKVITETGIPIFTNIIEDIKACNTNIQEMENVISKYYPDMKEKSIKRYVYDYRKNIGGDISPKVYNMPNIQKTKKRRRRKPKDAIGRDDTYHIWILQDEYDSVKKAINKWGFTATTESIVDVTGLKAGRVRASLHWMLKKHEIYMSRDNLTPTYHSIVK